MKYDYLYSYLNKSIQNIIDVYVKPYKELIDDYNFIKEKSIILFIKILESNECPKNMISYKVCIAACFWIIHKYVDDEIFFCHEITKCFCLHNISQSHLKYWESKILNIIKWELCKIIDTDFDNSKDDRTITI